MNKQAPAGYLERREYEARVPIIQSAVYQSMAENDSRFGGNDGLHAILIIGSLAKEYFRSDPLTRIRRASIHGPGSDLDFLTVQSNVNNPKHLTELNDQDIALIEEGFGDPEWIKRPGLRLTYLLRRNLNRAKQPMPVEPPYEVIDLDAPIEQEIQFLSDRLNPIMRLNAGLLFVPEYEKRRNLIIDIFTQSAIKVVMDPATTATVLQ